MLRTRFYLTRSQLDSGVRWPITCDCDAVPCGSSSVRLTTRVLLLGLALAACDVFGPRPICACSLLKGG